MKSEDRKKPRKRSFSDSINSRIDVAIVGMGGRFPQARGLGEFWENLINGKSAITEVPAHRWSSAADARMLDDLGQPRKFWGGFIDDADCFDAAFFKISPREAELMDPQQRILLEVVWHTLEDARVKPSAVAGSKIGVFMGISNTDYSELLHERGHSEAGLYGSTGTSSSILSNRVSYLFDFRGPSFTVNTASSSSLVAVHLAVKAVQAGECNSALAGGANICWTPSRFLVYRSAGMLSRDGLCKTFDEQADGYVRGEGVGAVFLKPLSEAISDGNYIYGVIKGSAVNHGGKTKGLTVTSPTQQCQLLVDAYLDADVHPETVGYIEAHGSGTSLGDPIEFLGLTSGFETLCKEFSGGSGQAGYCGLGSVKTNIGHLEAAAGIAGLIKVLLAMKHATIPANLNFKKLNPLIALDGSPFYLPTTSRTWRPITRHNRQFPRRAGVSSFGYGGAYAHLVIEEFNNPVPPATPNSADAQLMVLSAPNAERLRAWAGSVLDHLESPDREESISLPDLAYSLQVTREEFEERLAFVVADLAGLVDGLRSYLSGTDGRSLSFRGRAQKRTTTAMDEATIEQDLKDRALGRLAEIWVNGQTVDWNRLYDPRPVSIPLPLYPFASQRYWVPGADSGSDSANVADLGQARQPEPAVIEAGKPEVVSEVRIDAAALFDKVREALIRAISKLLKVGREEVDLDAEFSELGFDSIGLREFCGYLNQTHHLKLAPIIFFEYPSVRLLAEHLVKEQAPLLSERFAVGLPSRVTETAPDRSPGDRIPEPPAIQSHEPIAIIGVSVCFPQAADLETLWENLKSGRDCITEIPKDRWDWQALYGDPAIEPNRSNIKWGAFITEIAEFDPLFFGISPREAELMDPQQRLLMTYAWKAIEDAGYSAQSLSGSRTGIFIGTVASGYGELIAQSGIPIEGYSSTGTTPSVGPNRMSYFLNLHGPSEPIETACSSSLVAIHRAVRAMQSGDCEMALAGGINTIITPVLHLSFNKAGMLSEDGRCKTFSEDANGYVRGEGVGVLLLKRLSAAERDHDQIYGLIRGSSENHGGRANSLTAPNPKAQAELIKTAYTEAGIDPRTVGYIEAHGTGTPLGDPIEIQGLKSAFSDLYSATGDREVKAPHCGLGSVKTNIGHLELAAGVAGVIKVLLQLRHKMLVKSLHCERINPYIELEGSPFYIVQENRSWDALLDEHGRELPRRAGVSSFSFGGTNAHVIVEEYLP
ncbi:MAG TPA: beta-ketoacyl synthase N-terminal-like domain-containing protein, partial [Blastocatellia bacterium]|nr:beta-ketoacyl synthase N-terminal-like domain-containing protein [Blastocatellia bacterium]